ncbi:MAG: cytochrome c family protein [Myxococcales bacterium]|nr:cytochrome c family protein [Myxococcales bacterium]
MTRKASKPLAASFASFATFTLALVLGVVGALSLALADSAPTAAPGAPSAPSGAAAASAPTPAGAAAVIARGGLVIPSSFSSGHAPLAGGAKVPLKWLPPGAFEPDTGPSEAIYPPQSLTIRFNHKLHMTRVGAKCTSCHKSALTSQSAQDRLVPAPATCDNCHGTDHANLAAVKPGDDLTGQCAFCHEGYKPTDGNRVAKLVLPRANMIFNHKKHADKNINCQQCHGDVQELELATRDQLPRMRGCFGCHQYPDAAARGTAKGECENCHISGGASTGGKMKIAFPSGTLKPPRWMHNAGHTPDFLERHKMVAANDSQLCANCHKEDFCTACHDGRVRPRNIHPNDYISMHPVEARLGMQKCQSCHREQSFCLQCHQRLGITMSGPGDVRSAGRFHPPKAIWSDPPRQPGHHSQEAKRNLNACVSCHVERDCVVCHGGQGIGGGFNPHQGGFLAGCQSQFSRNPRPCYVCHDPQDGKLDRCR